MYGDRDVQLLVDALNSGGLPVTRVARADVACVMACVTGRLAGTPGAALIGTHVERATAGLAYASAERAPVIVIGSGPSGGERAAKATVVITAESVADAIARACRLAMQEPWGPVCLDLPPAVATESAGPLTERCRPAPLPPPDPAALAAAVRLLEASERPVLVIGRLCRSADEAAWIRAFAEARPAPALVTPGGRGVLPDPHPLVIGTLGGGDAEITLLASADLVVAVGVDPIEIDVAAWPAAVPVLEITTAARASRSSGAVSVVGEIGLIFEELAPRLRDGRLAEWDVARLHALKQAASAPPRDPRRLGAHRAVEAVRRLTPSGTIAVFERGQLWPEASRAWQAVAPGECLVPATRGVAVAAAIAGQLARPSARVVCFTDVETLGASSDQLDIASALGTSLLVVVAGDLTDPPRAPFAHRLEAALTAAGRGPLRIGLTADIS